MPRYLTQQDDYSCGPIAIYNAFLALKEKLRFRELRKECSPDPVVGTEPSVMTQTINSCLTTNINCTYTEAVNYSRIVNHLQEGGVIIIGEHWVKEDRTGEHYYTIVKLKNNRFKVVNYYGIKKRRYCVQTITPRRLKLSLMNYHKDENGSSYPLAWFLKKSNYN